MNMKKLTHSLALLGLSTHLASMAQTPSATQSLPRVEITGSSIKRIQAEGALPIEVITADDMVKRGIDSVQQMLEQVSGNASGADQAVSNNNIFGGDTDRLTGGSANANLRGFGPGSTLVLLNGRRVSTHGMSGGGVDINTIPFAAIQRVEVLKDGASAIYGTDAIGGVINFILKKDFEGVAVGVDVSSPMESSAGMKRRASMTVGKGKLDNDGFNVMASLSMDKNDILRGSDRDWASGFNPAMGLSPNSSSSPFANIITGSGTALGTGSRVGATDPTRYTRINLLSMRGQCDAVTEGTQFQPELWTRPTATAAQKASNIASGRYLCNTDYGSQYMLAAPTEAQNLVMHGSLKLSDKHTAMVELTGSRVGVLSELTPTQFSTGSSSNAAIGNNFYPVNGPYYLNLKDQGVLDFDPTKPISYRFRMQDWGNRVIDNVSTNGRLLLALEGVVGKYDYKLGLSRAAAAAHSNLHDGYAYSSKLHAAMKTGIINPWVQPGQTQTPQAMALIESTKARGKVMGGKTGLTQFDGSLSGELMDLPAGPLGFAVGFDARKETYEFANTTGDPDLAITCVSTLLTTVASDVLLCPGNSGVPLVSRDIHAVYGELAVPVVKGLDLQLAVRTDRYSGFGNTTNPKIAFRYQPAQSLVFRGSVNTGFKAPTFQQQQINTAPQLSTGKWADPVKCPTDPSYCDFQPNYTAGGNPDLKPEKSKQGTFGVVWAPADNLTLSADYWRVDLADRIRKLTLTEVLNNYDLFTDRFIRDAAGNVEVIRTGWINAAGSSTKGLDWGASGSVKSGVGQWSAAINGTHMLSHKEAALENQPLVEYVGTFGTRTLYLRDKFTASLTWSQGPWSSTLTGTYKSGYKDQDLSDRATMPATANTDVNSYTTFGLSATYRGFKDATITVGIRNLFDVKPPFTHHDVDDVAGAGWDPRVADPFGRTLTVSMKYSFK
ncbi:TonB-dependent receptor [Rhodoferax sp.]|uniref:TonB-dependent receptor n=1 Tax=Rhodoferax sp. TaxID=50421 RepID=UPI00276AA4A1|nr:TonB-dependent receptor [Rhodoferax sp.]